VSGTVTLVLRAGLDHPIDVEGVTPDRMAGLANREIAGLAIWAGARAVQVGDFFDVVGERSARVRVEGTSRLVEGLGAGTAGGELLVAGDAGARVAAGMTAGRVEVRGSVGDDAGLAMAGGILRVVGNAGDRLAAAAPGASKGMTGGEIVVGGAAGAGAAARARRGLVVVAGDAGAEAGRAMIAGTLVVFGRTGPGPGRGSRRGSIVAIGGIDVPPTYRYACTFQPPHVRLLMTYLQRRYALAVDRRIVEGRYRRYCGDAGIPGKGELLEWIPV
jgi:formylmethanofuran dehydrogenase subunit C